MVMRSSQEDLERLKASLDWKVPEFEEVQQFLEWLRDGNFVFLGYREYDIRTVEGNDREVQLRHGSSRGILSDERSSKVYESVSVSDLPRELTARVLGGPLLMVSKTTALSPVHRRARMDDISIKRLADDGTVLGERRFLGLFTAKAQRVPRKPLPIMRRTRGDFAHHPPSGLRTTWLGHSTILVEIDGHRILTDPVWSNRPTPVPGVGPKRFSWTFSRCR